MTDNKPGSNTLKVYMSESRLVSAFELILGAAIGIGYNVFKVIPNEVPILFVLGLLSVRLRNGGWAAMGLSRPKSWTRVVLLAVGAAVLRIVLGEVLDNLITARIWPPAIAPEGASEITGNPMVALKWLLVVWTFAAFGEEIDPLQREQLTAYGMAESRPLKVLQQKPITVILADEVELALEHGIAR